MIKLEEIRERLNAFEHWSGLANQDISETHAPDMRLLLRIVERQREALVFVAQQDRTRGYPTGSEWMLIDEKVRECIAEVEALCAK